MKAPWINIDRLRELLAYDPEAGVITWAVNRGKVRAGDEAGSLTSNGYRQLSVNSKRYLSHRVAWALTNGAWPAGDIDHIDGDGLNNRISNLRDVSTRCNIQNQKTSHARNKSGSSVQGVSWDARRGKFKSEAKRDGRTVHIGRFGTLAEADAASLEYRRANYEGFTL